MAENIEVDDEIDGIDDTDPVRIVSEVERRTRPEFADVDNYAQIEEVNGYFDTVAHAYGLFGIPFGVRMPRAAGKVEATALLYAVKAEVDKLRLDQLAKRAASENGVRLDATWKAKIHSYLARIREIVEHTEMEVGLKESILKRLHDLDKEVDRLRTPMRQFTDTLVGLCEGVSSGAEALKPAVRLFERVVGSLARLQRREEIPELPSPDTLGLPDYTNKDDESA